jgi:hypothetical protein
MKMFGLFEKKRDVSMTVYILSLKMPVDPIVFQCCPYGVVIHSVWGEEADDKVLEEYKTLNQKILSM